MSRVHAFILMLMVVGDELVQVWNIEERVWELVGRENAHVVYQNVHFIQAGQLFADPGVDVGASEVDGQHIDLTLRMSGSDLFAHFV